MTMHLHAEPPVEDRAQPGSAIAPGPGRVRGGGPDSDEPDLLLALGHDLRNPVHALCTALDVLQAAPPGSPASHDATQVALRQGRQLVRMVDDLLDLGRLMAGRASLGAQPQDFALLVERVIRSFEADGGHCMRHLAPVWVQADGARLEPALLRLLLCLAGGDAPLVATLDERGTMAVLELRAAHASPSGRGPDLHMLLTQRLVELHGGRLCADGPACTLELPVHPRR